MTEAEPSSPEGRRTIDIVRDSTFVRFTADEVLISDLGRDVEAAFIQYGDIFTSQIDFDDYEATEGTRVLTEVARLRMSYQDMLKFAMSFIRGGIKDEKLKGENVLKSIEQWVAEAKVPAISEDK